MSETMQTVRRAASQLMGSTNVRTVEPAFVANEPVAAAPARPAPTVISANAEIKGSITTTDMIEIRGKIEGDVRAASIMVCAGGKIKGDLTADTITVQGEVEGRLQAQDVRLQAGANVSGEIAHGSLGIETSAIFEGTIKRLGAKPANAQ